MIRQFLQRFLIPIFLMLVAQLTLAADNNIETLSNELETEKPIITPNIERKDVKIPHVAAGQFEFIGSAGIFQADGFSSDLMYAARIIFHSGEKLFFETNYGKAKISQEPRHNLGIPDAFSDSTLSFYDVGIGYNLLPGRGFFGKNYTRSTDLYASFDVGRANLDNTSKWAFSPGIGLRITPMKWLTFHIDFKDHYVAGSLTPQSKKLNNNLELSLGVGTYF